MFARLPLAIEDCPVDSGRYTITTIFSLIYMVFSQSFKLIWYWITGKHIVVSGCNEYVKTFVEDLRSGINKSFY